MKKLIEELVHLNPETLRLSEVTKYLKEYSTKFSSKLYSHDNKLYPFTTTFYERLDKISNINKVGIKIEASTLELEVKIETKIDKITADHAKSIDSFGMKLSSIMSKKPS